MVRPKAGANYENELALDVYRTTDGGLVPITTRASGNVAIPLPDIVIDDGEYVHAMECKRTSTDSVTFTSDPEDDPPTDDLYQLLMFAQLYPRKVKLYLGSKFPYRQLVLTRLWPDNMTDGTKSLDQLLDEAEIMCPVRCKNTRTNNFVVYKPDTDEWPSSQKGDDVEHVLESIGYELS